MKTKLFIILTFITIINISIMGDDPKLSSSWGEYQGEVNWTEAQAKCATLKMRLPTRAELTAAFESGITKSWKKDGELYWTSEEPAKKSRAYNLFITSGTVSYDIKMVPGHVRCIR